MTSAVAVMDDERVRTIGLALAEPAVLDYILELCASAVKARDAWWQAQMPDIGSQILTAYRAHLEKQGGDVWEGMLKDRDGAWQEAFVTWQKEAVADIGRQAVEIYTRTDGLAAINAAVEEREKAWQDAMARTKTVNRAHDLVRGADGKLRGPDAKNLASADASGRVLVKRFIRDSEGRIDGVVEVFEDAKAW